MSVVKNIKQRTTNNSFNTYPIGMNAEFITIPAGTANLYENNVNADEGMGILKNYIDEQISIAKVNFFVNYTDINGQVYNLRVYNDDTTNGTILRNTLNNIPQNITNFDLVQLYAPNFTNAETLTLYGGPYNIRTINSMNINVTNIAWILAEQENLTNINFLNFGDNLLNCYCAFDLCYNLVTIPNFDTSKVTDMYSMFWDDIKLINIPNFDTSNVIDMDSMFYNCTNLINVPNLNTSKVTNMSWMFRKASSLENAPRINLASAKDTVRMFAQDYQLININNILNTITENIENTVSMFEGCLRLNPNGYAIARNVLFQPNLVNTAYMFCTTNLDRVYLNQLFDGNEGRCNASHMFDNCRNFTNCSAISRVWDAVYDMSYMFANCNKLNYINGFSANYVNGIRNMVYGCNALTNAAIFNLANGLPHYNNITDSSKWNTLDYIGFTNNQMNVIANNPTVLNSIENKGWTVQKVKYELAYTYSNSPDTWLNYSLETTSISNNAQALRNVFSNKDIDTANIIKLNVINMSGVTNADHLFSSNSHPDYSFSKMTTVEHLNMQDLTSANYLFENDRNLINIFNINLGKLLSTSGMFDLCWRLTNVPNFNTSNVIDMSNMFYYCSNLITIPNFDTSKVTNMYQMFYWCTSLTNLTTIPNLNTRNVTNMSYMFGQCHNLINLPNFNTSNVKDMRSMFTACHNLINIPNFNTSNVTDMGSMFWYCNKLTIIPNFNTSKVTDMNRMFYMCQKLSNQSIDNIAYSLPLYENIINGNPSVNKYIGLSNTQINNMSANAKQAAEDKGWMVLPQIRIDYTYTNGVNGVSKIYNVNTMNGQQIRTELRNVFANNLYGEVIPATNWFVTNITMTSSNCNITDLNSLFFDGSKIKNISLDELDTTHLINLYSTFYMCGINKIPNINTSNVTNMSSCFSFCDKIINISNLYTSNVIDMSQTFRGCSNLVNISTLDMSKVTDITSIFEYCNNLSQNSLQNIIISIPDRDQIIGTTSTTNLRYLGLTATQINNLPTYYKQMAADKGWYVEGYEPKYTEMLVGTANALGDITFEDTETYPMRLTYDDMFGDYCLENTNQGKASTTSSAILTVSEDLLNVFDPMFRFLVYYASESNYDFTRIYKNDELLYEYSGYNGTTSYLDTTFWLEVKAGDVLKFEYEKDSSGDRGLDGCKIYISGWKNNKSYEVRYSTVDAPTTYITKFIPKEDN